ncbi:MAG: hypothetical protein SH819_10335 [Cytophagales bacterium]|nr:hypothetical protein [Cytophagales bacterium]
MKLQVNGIGLSVAVALFMASCFEPPQFSPIPSIEFESVVFKDVANQSDPDSLIVTLRFKDGDGNLGLDPDNLADKSPPFNNRYYFIANDGSVITYKTKRTNPAYDTLPAFVKPYNCVNWESITIDNKVDTFYFQLNPNHYNIFVDFMVKNTNGSFTKFDWTKEFSYPQCGITFDGRFPILSKDLSQKAALDGKIRYGMPSTGFLILFSIKTLKLRITIQDRKLNKSNTVESPEFTLQQIKKSG